MSAKRCLCRVVLVFFLLLVVIPKRLLVEPAQTLNPQAQGQSSVLLADRRGDPLSQCNYVEGSACHSGNFEVSAECRLSRLISTLSRDFGNSSAGVGPSSESSRRNPFIYHVPTPTNCSLMHHNAPATLSSPLTQCVWTFFWLALLIFLAFPLGCIGGQCYVIVSPLTVFTESCCKTVVDRVASLLLWTMHLPLICTQNMITAKPLITI